uniref:Neural proliferation differentiation and control protein 1 n=2 Tax=Macrostomum lignano TaxID=282301 RepID=A0A1I8HDZ2_9PLAT
MLLVTNPTTKVILLFVLTITAHSEQLIEDSKYQLSKVKDHGNFLSDCPILSACQALHRFVISCDAVSTLIGCGTCLEGYHSSPTPTKESRQDQHLTTCIQSSSPSESAAASLRLNEDSLVDQLSARSNANTDSANPGDPDSSLKLSARADPAGSNGTDGLGPDDIPIRRHPGNGDFVFYIIVGTTTGLGLLLIIICAVCWFKYNAVTKQADDEFVNSEFTSQQHKNSSGHPGDGKLALSAQMYHYQHQKQQMMAQEKSNDQSKQGGSDVDSDLENEDADFTVYECPGLATTGEMEVRNPLFKEELDQQQQQSQAAN